VVSELAFGFRGTPLLLRFWLGIVQRPKPLNTDKNLPRQKKSKDQEEE
jgi:hypothetical protein